MTLREPTFQPGEGMLAYMKRTTIKVDDEVEARMRQEADRRGITLSEWVREAVAAHLPGTAVSTGASRTFRVAGAGASGRSDISARFDELLDQMGFADHADERDHLPG